MTIKNAKYLTSVTDSKKLILDEVSEFAFVGRSNAGKSSMINALTGQKRLAHSSSTPGMTKMVNYFSINDGAFRFVDLPGYGFHRAGKKNEQLWAGLIEDYLRLSESLKTVFMLVDCQIEPTELDLVMLKYLIQTGRNFIIIATKCDKLSSRAQSAARKRIAKALSAHEEAVVLFSAQTLQGKQQILDYIENLI